MKHFLIQEWACRAEIRLARCWAPFFGFCWLVFVRIDRRHRRGGNVEIAVVDFQGRGGNEGNLGLVSLVSHGPAFPPRSPAVHARLRSSRNPRKSLRLAACICWADSVSLSFLAIWSNPWMPNFPLRKPSPSGAATSNSRNVSHGVA